MSHIHILEREQRVPLRIDQTFAFYGDLVRRDLRTIFDYRRDAGARGVGSG